MVLEAECLSPFTMLRVITGGEYKMFLSFLFEICITVEQINDEMLYSKCQKREQKPAFKTITFENIRRHGGLAADNCRAVPDPMQ